MDSWETVRAISYNKKYRTRKAPRTQLLPSSNFTGQVSDYGLRKDSILWVTERGYTSKVDLDVYLGLVDGQVCPGRGFSLDPEFESSTLQTVGGYARMAVMSKSGQSSWIDLDHFIGYAGYELCVSDLTDIPLSTRAEICSFTPAARGWLSYFTG